MPETEMTDGQYNRYVRSRFKLKADANNWVKCKLLNRPMTARVRDWLEKRKGEPTVAAREALEYGRKLMPTVVELNSARCVYYACEGTGQRVKIGTSRNLKQRIIDIRCYGDKGPVVCEPGGFKLERQRHLQFHEDRITGEWFRKSDKLIAWMAIVAASHPQP